MWTHRDEHAVSVLQLSAAAHQASQTLHVAHSDDADVIVETEGLDEGKVDLQSNVTLELLVHGQDAESHTVRIAVETKDW